jgi:hypothetical protein
MDLSAMYYEGFSIHIISKNMNTIEYYSFRCEFKTAASVVYWSEFLATDPEARVRFPALP